VKYILAGSGAEAEAHVAEKKYSQGDYVIVHVGMTRKRKKADNIETCGTWAKRPDLSGIMGTLKTLGFDQA